MSRHHAHRRPAGPRRGFTLLEALTATGILLVVVTAVSTAVVAGQQQAFEAHQRIGGALAAEEMMGCLDSVRYSDLPGWHGYAEAAGEMVDLSGQPYPDTYGAIGRNVTVVGAMEAVTTFNIKVLGRRLRVRAFDRTGRTICEIERFIPEPGP